MIKPASILEIQGYQLTIKFSNGEVRKIDLAPFIAQQNDNVDKEKMNDVNFFKQAKIGDLGQVFWMNAAWMKDENGTRIQCEYDLSPELVYHYSSMVNE